MSRRGPPASVNTFNSRVALPTDWMRFSLPTGGV
ncbi:hypothetical protein HNP02_007539 [Mycobacterium sp. AZCC_0083]|nr:hypothetical protein [Mycobacterium sp. AZCC_0083]